MISDELDRHCATLCPNCLESSWNGSECTRCDYFGNELVPNHVLPPRHILIDRYFIGLVLGEGGYAITYRALDSIENRKVAIKELFPNGVVCRSQAFEVVPRNPNGREAEYFEKTKENFKQEIEYLKGIKHDSVAKYIHDFTENHTAYLIMEYEDGSTLTQFVNFFGNLGPRHEYKRIPFDKSLQLILPIMEALSFLHSSQNFLHRDISPDNIFIRDVNGAILIDFGSARRAGEGSRLQKAGFTPPEIVEGRKTDQSAASDVYSVAATLYWCCTGDFAWSMLDGETTLRFRSLKEKGVQCPGSANAAVTKALARDPRERFQSVADFYKALQPAPDKRATDQTPYAPPHPPVTFPPKISRETLRKVIIAESLIIAAILMALAWFYTRGDNRCIQKCSVMQQIGMGIMM